MKFIKRIVFFFLIAFAIGVRSETLNLKDNPISLSIVKKSAGNYELRLELPPNFGFQREAPHRILLSGKTGVVVKKADLSFNGPKHPQKPEYYEYVKSMPLVLEGNGELEVNAKLFYCDFKKNICIPGKVSEVIKLP